MARFTLDCDMAAVDNALVHQKDEVFTIINRGTADDLRTALRLLGFARPTWVAAGYGYKWEECMRRLRDVARGRLENLRGRARTAADEFLATVDAELARDDA